MITAENITPQQLEELVKYYDTTRDRRPTKLANALSYILNYAMVLGRERINYSPPCGREVDEVNAARSCKMHDPYTEYLVIHAVLDLIESPDTPQIISACQQCEFGIAGIRDDIRRSICTIPQNGAQALVRELARDIHDPEVVRFSGSPGFVFVESRGELFRLPVFAEIDSSQISKHMFIELSSTNSRGQLLKSNFVQRTMMGYNIGNFRFCGPNNVLMLNPNTIQIPLALIPHELAITPNQHYALATAGCLIHDLYEQQPDTYHHIVDLGAGGGWLGVFCSKLLPESRVTFVEMDPEFQREIHNNCLINNITNPGIQIATIQHTGLALYAGATHAVINIGDHYRDGSETSIQNIIKHNPTLRYVCFGGYHLKQTPELIDFMESHGFAVRTITTAPLIKSIAEMQLGKGYIESDVPYIGCTAISFTR